MWEGTSRDVTYPSFLLYNKTLAKTSVFTSVISFKKTTYLRITISVVNANK